MTVTIRSHVGGKWFWSVETNSTYCDGLVYTWREAVEQVESYAKPSEHKED